MGEEFHAIIKLISGEEILSSVCIDEDSDCLLYTSDAADE